MSAQLEHPRQPVPAPLPQPWGATRPYAARTPRPERPVAQQAPPPRGSRTARLGPDRGLGLLLSFTGAMSVMVADVVLIGAVAEWWILVPGFAVLLAMTGIVFRGIMRLLADGGKATTRDAR